jgi:chromosome segregation ATPase
MLLQEDLQTHMDVSRSLYAAMSEKDSDIATFKALLKMVVPNADDRLPIDDLLNIVAASVDELVKGSDALQERLETATDDTADYQSQLAECHVTSQAVLQRRQAIEAQLSTMPDFNSEVVDLEVQEDVLTRKLRGLHARIEKLQQESAAATPATTAQPSPSNPPSWVSELPPAVEEPRRSSLFCCCRRRAAPAPDLAEPMICDSACSDVLPPLGP